LLKPYRVLDVRILVLSTTDIVKAAHSRPHQMVSHLSRKHSIDVLCTNAWWLSKKGAPLYFHEYNHNVGIEYFGDTETGPLHQEWSAASSFRRRFYERLDGYDVVVDFDSLIAGYSAAKAARRCGLPFVFDIDDDLPSMIRGSSNVPFLLRRVASLVSQRYTRRLCKQADKVTVTLESLAAKCGIGEGEAEIIPNGVDTELFKPIMSDMRKRLGIDNEFVLGYVGVLREWVDLSIVFDAIRTLDNVKLLIVGEEGFLAENIALAEKLGVENRVLFAGTVPYERVPDYISAMDACIIPFREYSVSHEAAPLKLFEYMACAKPVISSRIKGVMSLAGRRVEYYSDAGDLRALILEFAAKKDIGGQGISNREWVEKNFGWLEICNRFEKLLVRLAN
jgi:glycosyltransferase involved in cell wall biosynthesis